MSRRSNAVKPSCFGTNIVPSFFGNTAVRAYRTGYALTLRHCTSRMWPRLHSSSGWWLDWYATATRCRCAYSHGTVAGHDSSGVKVPSPSGSYASATWSDANSARHCTSVFASSGEVGRKSAWVAPGVTKCVLTPAIDFDTPKRVRHPGPGRHG